MNPLAKIWFWLLLLSIIGFIVSLIMFEAYGQTNTDEPTTQPWIWVMFAISFAFWVIALILYIIDVLAYKKRMEIAEACGELPPPPPKKVIVCPKRTCKEKIISECTSMKPCDTVKAPTISVQPINQITAQPIQSQPIQPQPIQPQPIQPQPIQPQPINVIPRDNAFAAGNITGLNNLPPLDSLSPVVVRS